MKSVVNIHRRPPLQTLTPLSTHLHLHQSANEDGNEWLQALNQRDPHALLWGVTKIRKYVCGEGSDAHAAELIEFKVLERLQDFLDLTTPTDTLVSRCIRGCFCLSRRLTFLCLPTDALHLFLYVFMY